MEKNPDERFQNAHDVKLQLAWITRTGSQGGRPAQGGNKRRATEVVLGVTACVLAILVVALLSGWWRGQPIRSVARSTLLPPEGTHFAPLYRNGSPALSPDGKRMAFVASRDGKTSLWLRPLDKLDATELPGTEGAYYPFWSPDGHSIGFFANGKLWRMDASGGLRAHAQRPSLDRALFTQTMVGDKQTENWSQMNSLRDGSAPKIVAKNLRK